MRYILAGFCDYKEREAASKFSQYYDPLYDGFAFEAGFRTGDRISALEVCEVQVDLNGDSVITRKLVDIHTQMTDAEWVAAAQSCETLERDVPVLMVVQRWT